MNDLKLAMLASNLVLRRTNESHDSRDEIDRHTTLRSLSSPSRREELHNIQRSSSKTSRRYSTTRSLTHSTLPLHICTYKGSRKQELGKTPHDPTTTTTEERSLPSLFMKRLRKTTITRRSGEAWRTSLSQNI